MRLALAALLLTASPALAEMPPGVSHFTLENGMEAVVIEDHRAPVVVQMVWYKIGSADEVPGKTGLAHYLEHLMFKGTDKLAAGELSKTVTANGGMDNAFTSYDFTAYFQRIAADRLDLVMGMEADRMANLRIGEDDWQAERQVVLEERAQRTDSDPRALFGEERSAVQYYNHPYGRPVIGWRQEMTGLTREDALGWYDQHYAPNNAVLIVAGDVTADEVRALAEKHYGPIPADPAAVRAARPPVVILTSNRTREVHDALKRRCLYHWLAHPDFDREVAILRRRLPDVTDRLFVTIAASDSTLAPMERLKTIYPRYLDAAPIVSIDGLSTQVFRDGTAYQGEDLVLDPTSLEHFLLRCTRITGLTPAMCLHERRIGGADITVRFPRDWLSDWRAVSDAIERLIAGFKPQA